MTTRLSAALLLSAALTVTGCSAASSLTTDADGPRGAAPLEQRITRVAVVRALPLTGHTIVLDPGHNGLNATYPARASALVPAGGFRKPCNTAGTSTNSGYSEHRFAWALALRTAALLRAQGARVVLTRPSDAGFGPCVNVRAAIATRARATLSISLHADGARADGYGFHVIEPGLAPDRGNRAVLTASHRLALGVRSSFRAATGRPYATYTAQQGLARRTDLGSLNLARVPSVLVETGNMRHAGEARLLTTAAFQQRAAQGLTHAVLGYVAGR